MTKLVLSPATSKLLKHIAKQINSDHDAVQSLKAALLEQMSEPKMTTQSPAVPSSSSLATDAPIVVDHKVLINLASWACNQDTSDLVGWDPVKLKLSSLVIGSHVHLPPKPAFQRSKELEESLAAIRRAQEEADYHRISTTTTINSSAYKIPSSYVNIAGVDPSLSLSQRISSHSQIPQHLTSTSSRHLLSQSEEQAWKDAQRQLSVILNVILSTLATATAAWWASGHASPANKVMVSMLVAVITALAEIVLYNRYSVYVKESQKIKRSRMKGSDSNREIPEFRPLRLDRSPAEGTHEKEAAPSPRAEGGARLESATSTSS